MTGTDGFEDKLNQILNDPESMAQILSLAQSFGGGQSDAGKSDAEKSAPFSPPSMPDDSFITGIMQLMQQSQHSDGKHEALLCALKPYLAEERRDKIDRALRIARISHIAGFALRNYGLLGKQGG